MDAAAGDRLLETEHAERRDRLYRFDQSLHRHAESGDGLQDRHAPHSRSARESEETARREIRSAGVSRRGADEWPRSARYAGATGRRLGEIEGIWLVSGRATILCATSGALPAIGWAAAHARPGSSCAGCFRIQFVASISPLRFAARAWRPCRTFRCLGK